LALSISFSKEKEVKESSLEGMLCAGCSLMGYTEEVVDADTVSREIRKIYITNGGN